ncbi:hypothetical protein FRC00_012374 [Tulasnella sp. 408]|nr:hypothetical protein FRC00_012374 [Tulasnella sp. 408]
MSVMRELVEDAETELINPQIKAASGADGALSFYLYLRSLLIVFNFLIANALKLGKIKIKISTFRLVPNQVRSTRHGGSRHVVEYLLSIQIAQGQAGDDTSDDRSKLEKEQGKSTKNVGTDVKSAGQPSKADTGTVSPRD